MKRKFSYLLRRLKHLAAKEKYSEGHSALMSYDREWEDFYRNRHSYDKFVFTTHGVNCTGSCRWKVYVKNGVITWEHQAIDYPSTGPNFPEYEPRGCPRGASFSWYIYSPLRVKYPYVRGVLLELWREAKKQSGGDPVKAWEIILSDPEKERKYKSQRGRGGFVRTSWDEVYELIASQLIHTIKKYGPDRIAGFTPIPAMSMVSYASGARFLSLIGGTMLSFYDWYADLPPASPQVWGEQTDVPESGDWYNADYLIMWGSNVPMTRSPDAHFMTEVRYKGAKVVSVSPDYAESVKFADEWVPVRAGTDGALAMGMTHVILKEFYADKQEPYFQEYAKRYTDLPFLVLLKKEDDGFVIERFLRATDIGKEVSNAEWKLVVWDTKSGKPVLPNGTVGYRWEDSKKWNLKLEDEEGNKIDPALTLLGIHDEVVTIKLPYFEDDAKGVLKRAIPVKKLQTPEGEIYVTTVLDLMFANFGVARPGVEEGYPKSYEDDQPHTPKWQEKFTGVPAEQVIRIAREFARNAALTKGRSMIIMGAGINHWYNADIIYRAILNLVMLTGSEGRNGGGWAHYVGQEKVRPFEGWATLAFARDWYLPPRIQNATTFYYFASEQYRYEDIDMENIASPLVKPRYKHPADYLYLAVRLGWLPHYPQFNKSSIELAKEAEANGAKSNEEIVKYVVEQLKKGELDFAVADPANPVNFPRSFFVWRANWLSAGGKGHEYFIKHMLGSENGGLLAQESPIKPQEVKVREPAPVGKVDLVVNLDFRMAGTALYSDVVLPAATWYEKEDLSSTDMHPFLHVFNAAIDPPWEARSDWDIFKGLAKKFSELAKEHLPGTYKDVVTAPLMHDTPFEIAQPYGKVLDWKKGEVEPIPGKTMPQIAIVERSYTDVYERYISVGPLVAEKPFGAHGWKWSAKEEYEELKELLGTRDEGVAKGKPNIEYAKQAANMVLTLSSCSNGRVASKAWKNAEEKTGLPISEVAKDHEGLHFTFDDLNIQPRVTISTPIFTGNTEDYRHLQEIWEKFDEKPLVPDTTHMKSPRRFAPFTNNTELLIPFRTLTGRQQFMLDHELFLEIGEALPVYKPPLKLQPFEFDEKVPETVRNSKTIKVRYLTPHGKWHIHSTFFDNIRMLTLFRGGQYVWINDIDAKEIGVKDNDWIEIVNRNGVIVARAVVSHRIPRGTAFMYHAQDRTIFVPISETTGQVGGSHNAAAKIHIKPTHAVGGYAQLAYGFNYYGPTGTQRDEVVYIRKVEKPVFPEVEV